MAAAAPEIGLATFQFDAYRRFVSNDWGVLCHGLAEPFPIMWQRVVDVRPQRNDSCWVHRFMAGVIVVLDVLHIDGRCHARLL